MGLISKAYRAFTLWELIVVMVITTTIVSLSYGSYRGFTNILQADEHSMQELNKALNLERILGEMVECSKAMELTGNVIWFDGFSDGSALEFLDSTLVVYGESEEDDLSFGLVDWEVDYLDGHSDYISSFSIDIKMEKHDYRLVFRKHYSKRFLLGMSSL